NSLHVLGQRDSAMFAGTDTAARTSWSPSVNRSVELKVRTSLMTSAATDEATACTRNAPGPALRTITDDRAGTTTARYRFNASPLRFPSTSFLYAVCLRRSPPC